MEFMGDFPELWETMAPFNSIPILEWQTMTNNNDAAADRHDRHEHRAFSWRH